MTPWMRKTDREYVRDDGACVTRDGHGVQRPWTACGPGGLNNYLRKPIEIGSDVKGGARTFKHAETAMAAVDKAFPCQ